MTIQRLLYNQLNKEYLYDDADQILLMHKSWKITSSTSAGTLSLNIYSKLVAYAWSLAFADSVDVADFTKVESWMWGLIEYAKKHTSEHIIVMDACEAYISDRLQNIKSKLEELWITLEIRPNTQFLISHEQFLTKFATPPVMETFYRWMRKETRVLMDGESPMWWEWNFDKHNRKFDRTFEDIEHLHFKDNTYRDKACEAYVQDIQTRWKTPLRYIPTTREEAQELLAYFVTHHLDRFGELEDAMYTSSDFVYHSLLSIPLNFGLLTPSEVIQAIEKSDSAINNKEWCIRQILWWREYMYHRFLTYKDTIYEQNHFEHTRELPYRFWKPETAPDSVKKMKCVSHVLEKVERLWYSHHIERLMIIGNFCLLVWFDPHDTNKRFWEQYADAFERVVTPNVLGMSQYADGGNLATKPYVASANYVNKMSNYCKHCAYNPKEKYGEDACPLNYMYWKFLNTNQETFIKWRQSFILKHLEKIDLDLINEQSKAFISSLTKDAKE